MIKSNRDFVNNAVLELLPEYLAPYLQHTLKEKYGTVPPQAIRRRGFPPRPFPEEIDYRDTSELLRILTTRRTDGGFIIEIPSLLVARVRSLRETRNLFSHGSDFDTYQTLRVLCEVIDFFELIESPAAYDKATDLLDDYLETIAKSYNQITTHESSYEPGQDSEPSQIPSDDTRSATTSELRTPDIGALSLNNPDQPRRGRHHVSQTEHLLSGPEPLQQEAGPEQNDNDGGSLTVSEPSAHQETPSLRVENAPKPRMEESTFRIEETSRLQSDVTSKAVDSINPQATTGILNKKKRIPSPAEIHWGNRTKMKTDVHKQLSISDGDGACIGDQDKDLNLEGSNSTSLDTQRGVEPRTSYAAKADDRIESLRALLYQTARKPNRVDGKPTQPRQLELAFSKDDASPRVNSQTEHNSALPPKHESATNLSVDWTLIQRVRALPNCLPYLPMPLEKIGWRSELQSFTSDQHAWITFNDWLVEAARREAPVCTRRLMRLVKRSYRIQDDDTTMDRYILHCLSKSSVEFGNDGFTIAKHPQVTFRDRALDYISIDELSLRESEMLLRAILSESHSPLSGDDLTANAFKILCTTESAPDAQTQATLSRILNGVRGTSNVKTAPKP